MVFAEGDLTVPGVDAGLHSSFEVPEDGSVAVGTGVLVVLIGFLLFLRQFTVFLDGDHVALVQSHIMGIAQIIRNGLPGEVTAVFRLIQIDGTEPAA